jgi:hypothetical protein
MENSGNLWDKIKKIGNPAILTISGILITTVAAYFGIPLESEKAQKSEQPANTSSTSATGIEGGIHINNYPLQPPAPQPVVQPTQQPIPTTQKKIAQTNITQETNGDGNCPVITNGDNNSVNPNCSTTKIEKQTNNRRSIQAEQYIEKTGENNTNCEGNSNSACGNGTINLNPPRQ